MMCSLLEWTPPFAAGVPLWAAHMKGVSFSCNDSLCLRMFGCLFSLSLKCCLIVPIYDNRPLNVYRNNCTVTRRAESRSLLQSVAFVFFPQAPPFLFNSLQEEEEEEESRPPAPWLTLGWRGLWSWWSRAREGCQMLQKLMTEKRKWQIHNFLYWHRSSGGKTQL